MAYNIFVKFTGKAPGAGQSFVKEATEAGVVDKIRAEDGCIAYDYYFSAQDDKMLLLIEQWESFEHQQVHLKQPHMDELRAIKGKYIVDTVIKDFTL